MRSCEKCWDDAGMMAMEGLGYKADLYRKLIKERDKNPCSPKEQAGQWWDEEKQCDIRSNK